VVRSERASKLRDKRVIGVCGHPKEEKPIVLFVCVEGRKWVKRSGGRRSKNGDSE